MDFTFSVLFISLSLGFVRADARHLYLCDQHDGREGPKTVREPHIQEAWQKRGYGSNTHTQKNIHTLTYDDSLIRKPNRNKILHTHTHTHLTQFEK